jgi:hypothetical protein
MPVYTQDTLPTAGTLPQEVRAEICRDVNPRLEARAVTLRTEAGKQHLHLLEAAVLELCC